MKHLLYIFFFFFFIHFLGFAEASQDSSSSSHIEALNDLDLAVSVSDNKTITEISSSIVKAETWLKTHVLSLYPSTKITTIVIFFPHLPDSSYYQTTELDLVLSSLKNLHHSLTRWGLERDIKVSLGFSSSSYQQSLNNLEMFKPVLNFLKSINSTLTINPPLNHLDFLKTVEKFGSLSFNKVNFLNPKPQQEQATTTTTMTRRRNLRSFVDISSKITVHFPTLPSPSPEENSPIGSPTTNPSSPNESPTNPIPPIFSQIGSPINPNPPIGSLTNPNAPISSPIGSPLPPTNPNSPISQPPISSPTNPNHPISQSPPINPNPSQPPIPQSSPNLSLPPPCLPSPAPSPTKKKEGLWCVAKPTVAAETLQQALDFACGEGGADCEEIKSPHGICFYPDTAVAHASYAFNSYWQKTKRNGGTCSFGGTAMLITTDPSYQHCRFILS